MTILSELFPRLADLLVADLDLSARREDTPNCACDIDSVCSDLIPLIHRQSIVYTAFDGDHFHLCGHMRRHVLSQGLVPANPESVLGYRDTVMARLSKRGVLLDDITVLRGCDEMWIFTELRPKPACVATLAEGVVAELLFFLKRRPGARVRFVSPAALARGGTIEHEDYPHSYEETHDALHVNQREGILDLANSGGRVDSELRAVAYHITDPLDFKYAQWLRSYGYQEKQVPLIPGLAVDVGDGAVHGSLGQVVASWAALTRLATRAWVLPMMEPLRRPSAVAELLEQVWLRTHGAATLGHRTWAEYPIPKAQIGNRWPLTKHEGGLR